jgi:hypothetical protein
MMFDFAITKEFVDSENFTPLGEPNARRIVLAASPARINMVHGKQDSAGQDMNDVVVKRNNYITLTKFTGATDNKRYRLIATTALNDRGCNEHGT